MKFLNKKQRNIIIYTYNYKGHAVVSWFLEGGNPLLKVEQ